MTIAAATCDLSESVIHVPVGPASDGPAMTQASNAVNGSLIGSFPSGWRPAVPAGHAAASAAVSDTVAMPRA